MFFYALFFVSHVAVSAASFPAGVIATGTQGVTNPPVPTMPTTLDQTSMARLISVNSIDDFCIFAPPYLATIPDTESIEVAWCTQPRNNARVIPDGTFTGVSFLKTDFYVQIYGFGDFTKLNIAPNDGGGELDPHGATGAGNPEGGNVTTTIIDGIDQPIAEWMLYIDNNQFCLRACTNANSTYSAAFMCWHELDEMGCEFVMPGTYNYQGGVYETCDADVAYPPGWYPEVDAETTKFSTFAQYATGVYTGGDGQPTSYTVGDTTTPSGPYSTPKSSNCVPQASISNGIALASLTAGAKGTAPPSGFASSTLGSRPTSMAPTSNGTTSGAPASSSSVGTSTASSTPPTSSSIPSSGTHSSASVPPTSTGSTDSTEASPSSTGSSAALPTASIGRITLAVIVVSLAVVSLLC
ncbi:hypothetical protein B0H17DRAFT_1093533 [Mycena rosella]|uniref:Uncharacterized protein n=1 Tax=Mycena rosella TaxID=1033263 RepID=A0AAD7G326_MYCRO|nr:hypothetical protein B0H17DRAFT_1093533 [Mycena rosella]